MLCGSLFVGRRKGVKTEQFSSEPDSNSFWCFTELALANWAYYARNLCRCVT